MSAKVIKSGEKTVTESDIVRLLSDGLTIKEVSRETSVNKRTLEQRLANMRSEYKVKSTIALVAHFIRNELID